MHFYVYTFQKGYYLYRRTCGTKQAAKDWVTECQSRGLEAVCLEDHLVSGAFY